MRKNEERKRLPEEQRKQRLGSNARNMVNGTMEERSRKITEKEGSRREIKNFDALSSLAFFGQWTLKLKKKEKSNERVL